MTSPSSPDVALALSYASAERRPALAALLALDDALGSVLRTGRDPMVSQLRLTWWHDAIAALDHSPPPAQPALEALAEHVRPHLRAATLLPLVEGWEELIEPGTLPDEALERYGEARGGTLFGQMAALLDGGPVDTIRAAGRAWALYDLAAHTSEADLARRAKALADRHVAAVTRLPPATRALGALMHLARLNEAAGSHRVARLLFHRLTGL